MVEVLEAILSTLAAVFALGVIPVSLCLMTYGMYWAKKRHDIMLKVFEAFKEMGTCRCVPPSIVIKCANEISDLTSSGRNKLVAIRAKSTLMYIEDQTSYYKEKKAKEDRES